MCCFFQLYSIYILTYISLDLRKTIFVNQPFWNLWKHLYFYRLNYCCTIYYKLLKELIKKHQYVQNSAARLISSRKKNEHISDIIQSYKWLNVENFILFRNLYIVYKCLCEPALHYLLDTIALQEMLPYELRSSTEILLKVNRRKTTFGEGIFHYIQLKFGIHCH